MPHIKGSPQPMWGPEDKPLIPEPCVCRLDVPVAYLGANGTIPSTRGITCDRDFARIVLGEMERWALRYGFGIVHLGVYNPRKAQKKNGQIIKPERWSNHSYGTAIDFAGITTREGEFLGIGDMQDGCPAKLAELKDRVAHAMIQSSRRAEIVDEGGWIHLGIWQK